MALKKVVAITGCDSGLGYALAARSAREGLVTVAGMLCGTDTTAATALAKLTVHPCSLDVTKAESVADFGKFVSNLLAENPSYRLYAVVNNAGVMTIGDYEWQTPSMIENTVNVNLLGPMRVVSTLLPQLRTSATEGASLPRIINVASHCGFQPLPGFGAYSASKAGLLAWTQALRYELTAQGLTALAFVPGGFVGSSNILSRQSTQCNVMLQNLNEELRFFYEKKITTLRDYLQNVPHNNSYDSLTDVDILETFIKALTDDDPKAVYKVESWRYAFYYNLMKLPLPEALHRWLINKFLCFPDA